jgi:hypothetical protein
MWVSLESFTIKLAPNSNALGLEREVPQALGEGRTPNVPVFQSHTRQHRRDDQRGLVMISESRR